MPTNRAYPTERLAASNRTSLNEKTATSNDGGGRLSMGCRTGSLSENKDDPVVGYRERRTDY